MLNYTGYLYSILYVNRSDYIQFVLLYISMTMKSITVCQQTYLSTDTEILFGKRKTETFLELYQQIPQSPGGR